jgi:signal transduction histidine kinase
MMTYEHARKEIFHRRLTIIKKLLLLLGMIMAAMSVIRYISGDLQQAAADALLGIFSFLARTLLSHSNRYYKAVIYLVYFAAVAASVHVLVYQTSPVRLVWFTTVSYFVFFLFPKQEAGFQLALLCFILCYIGLFHLDDVGLSATEYMMWMTHIVFVLIISKWYFDLENDSMQRLRDIQVELEAEVKKKTAQLKQKTDDLQALTETLEEQIINKSEEILRKEQLIFKQARQIQMSEMLNMIAHQWRQPLNTIAVSSHTLEKWSARHSNQTDTIKRYTSRISEQTEQLSKTIDIFRNIYASNKEKEFINVCNVIDNIHYTFASLLSQEGIELSCKCEKNIIVETYVNDLYFALHNILQNAKEAFAKEQKNHQYIRIYVRKNETFAFIDIEDNASGILQEIREHVFNPYVTTKESDGSGLGLYIAKELIERQCNGKITFQSSDSGTVFTIALPLFRESNENDTPMHNDKVEM